jgi:hypothetical protein
MLIEAAAAFDAKSQLRRSDHIDARVNPWLCTGCALTKTRLNAFRRIQKNLIVDKE